MGSIGDALMWMLPILIYCDWRWEVVSPQGTTVKLFNNKARMR
jgi:hypothetical protein